MQPVQYSASAKNQAQEDLDFDALEKADKFLEPPDEIVEIFRNKTHNDAVAEINRLSAKGIFMPLAFAPLFLAKMCDERYGEIAAAERIFDLVNEKYEIDPQNDTRQKVNALYAELMWVYIKRNNLVWNKVTSLATERSCAETLTALASFYLKKKRPDLTLELYREWPEAIKPIGSTFRYPAYAMIDLKQSFEERRQIFVSAIEKYPELRGDAYFTADYIRLAMMNDCNSPTSVELEAIEEFFAKNPHLRQQDCTVRELIRACFKASELAKAQHYFTPCLDQTWLSNKTFITIVTETARHALQDAINIYAARIDPFRRVDKNRPCYTLDFHSRVITSHGTEETDSPNLHFVALQIWHLYTEIQKLDRSVFVKVTLITGKGKSRKLKKSVQAFLKNTFDWNYKDLNPDSGVFVFSDRVSALRNSKVRMPEALTSELPFLKKPE